MGEVSSKINDKEVFLKEITQLGNMEQDDAVEVVKGYHDMLEKCIGECTNGIRKIADLSPATMRLTKTAVIIAESDFFSEYHEEGCEQLCIFGAQKDIAKLLKCIIKNCPEAFDEIVEDIAKEKGYAKA